MLESISCEEERPQKTFKMLNASVQSFRQGLFCFWSRASLENFLHSLKQKNMNFSETRFAIVAKIEVLVSSKDSEMDCQVSRGDLRRV